MATVRNDKIMIKIWLRPYRKCKPNLQRVNDRFNASKRQLSQEKKSHTVSKMNVFDRYHYQRKLLRRYAGFGKTTKKRKTKSKIKNTTFQKILQ